jgi:acyl-coenzyme A synthetase/AMP-(fatty) acid ligase
MLKVSGKWLAPAEVENCLLQHPRVAEVAVVGVVDANGLTKPHAFVVARAEARSSDGARAAIAADLAEELRTLALERLEPYKAPRRIVLMDALPRTHLGKVDRGKLRGSSG